MTAQYFSFLSFHLLMLPHFSTKISNSLMLGQRRLIYTYFIVLLNYWLNLRHFFGSKCLPGENFTRRERKAKTHTQVSDWLLSQTKTLKGVQVGKAWKMCPASSFSNFQSPFVARATFLELSVTLWHHLYTSVTGAVLFILSVVCLLFLLFLPLFLLSHV